MLFTSVEFYTSMMLRDECESCECSESQAKSTYFFRVRSNALEFMKIIILIMSFTK